MTFQEAVCAHFKCRPKDYLLVALKHTLYPQARPLAWYFLLLGSPTNTSLLEAAAEVTTQKEMHELLREYAYIIALRRRTFMNKRNLRVSGKRLQLLFNEVMYGEARVPQPQGAASAPAQASTGRN